MREACGALCLTMIAIFLVIASMGMPAQSADSINKAPMCSFNATGKGPCPLSMLGATNNSNDSSTDVSIQSWRGRATKDGESHPIRLNLERIISTDPTEVRRLLSSNASLEDIQSSIRTKDAACVRRGNIRLEDGIYQLTNITVVPSGIRSVLDAGISGPIDGPMFRADKSSTISASGHITLAISEAGFKGVAEGTLVMDSSDFRGTYQVKLDQQSPGRGHRAGMTGQGHWSTTTP
jgi:hypothetical protein